MRLCIVREDRTGAVNPGSGVARARTMEVWSMKYFEGLVTAIDPSSPLVKLCQTMPEKNCTSSFVRDGSL